MPAFFHWRKVHYSKTARAMKNGVTKIGTNLLDDPRLSDYKRFCLQNLLNTPIETLRQYSTGNDEATLLDVISFLVKETCSEIVDLAIYESSTIETNSFIMACIPETIDFDEDTYDDDASNLTQHQHQQQRKDASDIVLANPSTILPVTRMTHHENDRINIIDDDEKSADNGVTFSVSQHNQRKFVSDVNEWPQSFLPDTTSPTSTTIPSTNYVPSRDSFDCITPSMHTLNVQFNLYPAAVQPQLHDDTPVFDSPENAAVPTTIRMDPVTADNATKVLLAHEQSPLADHDNPSQNSDHNIYCDDYEHEHDNYYGSINHHSNGNLTKYEHEHDDYDERNTHHEHDNDDHNGNTIHQHSSNENLNNYYENDSGDGYYSNIEDYYLDDYYSDSDDYDGSLEI